MSFLRMDELDLNGKRVMIREDFNVPLEAGRVTSDARLQAARAARPAKSDSVTARQSIGSLRMAAYFNPRLFVDIRRRTEGHRADIKRRVKELNQELAQAKSKVSSRVRKPPGRSETHET